MCKRCTIEARTRAAVALTTIIARDAGLGVARTIVNVICATLAGPESDPTDELYARPVVMPWHGA